ncbi:NAD(P)/FAD-dependent oxidoreductase [Microbacterium sp.]|uniref:NAD(P)/FAD-dependent oxidoreductase n=1 Tax=Microbacterium sp. TaxID=51671 RepID=UPI002E379EAE|nr:NAD(P)/FAD-dependent oxidoreductase [Microbacterium sp.]HEX5728194.1 NAD(P)/FAD-dependent oxidoreductase [Microbacterium sp.]
MDTHDTIVIGAGLAGLRGAARLAQAGRDVVVLESEDVVGGRQRTDSVDGFLLDRGFQILNPAYPAVKRWVDVTDLRLQRFPVGVRVRRESDSVELTHPMRHPTGIPATLHSGLVSPKDLAALVRWLAPALLRPRSVITGKDRTLRAEWERIGLRGPLRTQVLEPFLAGVLGEDDGTSSDAFTRLLMRMFALGSPGLPANGIGALPAQLARVAAVAGADIRLEAPVRRLRSGSTGVEVDVEGANTLRARSVIVAVGPGAVSDLLEIPAPATNGLQTWWFASDVAPTPSALLAVDGRRRGPVINTVVISNGAPSYAPRGRHLVAATCLLPKPGRADAGDPPREDEVRRTLAEIWDADCAGWELLRRDDIAEALPVQPAPLRTTSPPRVGDGLYVAGDHRDTASIQGALVSGERAAHAVLTDRRG